MNCPEEPDNTCPLIDDVIEEVEKLHSIERNTCITFDDVDFGMVKEKMEEIRSANSDLRERAQFFEQQAGEFEEEKDKANERADNAEAELADVKAKLESPQTA